MISVEQWRAAIGCFSCCQCHCGRSGFVNRVVKNRQHFSFRTFIRLCMCIVILFAVYAYLPVLLLLGGDVEINPGPPTKQCPHCSARVHIRIKICKCGRGFGRNKGKSVPYSNQKKIANVKSEKQLQKRERCRQLMTHLRASESIEAALRRREQSRVGMARLRASQSLQTASQRRQQSREGMANLRATEPPEFALLRAQQTAACVAIHRARTVTIDDAIIAFHSKIRIGPEFVCAVCHRMMYRQTVVSFIRDKYTKGDGEMLDRVFGMLYTCPDGKQWICVTCHNTLLKGRLPVQATANGLEIDEIPPELNNLNMLELRLICLRVPFMKMVALPRGKQQCIHGPAVNVPSKVDAICTVLPRLPSQTELLALKLKRRLRYKGYYMFNYVTPDHVMSALRWLKANNPLYSDVNINDNWANQSLNDDSDIFTSLVEQSDSSDVNFTVEMTDVSDDVSVEVDLSENTDTVAVGNCPYSVLTAMARDCGYKIHDVAGNGNCLFHAICYQLEPIGIEHFTASVLRAEVVNYLSHNPYTSSGVHYSDFLARSNSASNVSNAQLWHRYLRGLYNGDWGDHITVQGISDMLNITINILSTIGSNVTVISPASGDSVGNVYIGLMGETHYVGLDPIVYSSNDNDCPENDASPSENDAEKGLDDASIEKGDEHTRQITGGPQVCSVLTLENPVSEGRIYSIAPAEGQRPINIMTDESFERMANPDKFPYGKGGFNSERSRQITYRKYFNQRLMNVDGRFARDLDYLFVAQYIVESKQIHDDASHFIWRQKLSSALTAGEARNQTTVSENVRKDRAYSFMKNIRGSPPYYQRTFYELLAMIRQLGTPTWFLTLTAADMKWPDIITIIARQYGVSYTDDEIAKMSFDEKCNWIRRNPVTAARHFQYRLNTFFSDFLKSSAQPLGEISDYGIRIEFQSRGSPHAHTVIWVKDAPKFGVNDNQTVCNFIDKYVACEIPREEGKLKELVLSLQQHRHSSYCRKRGSCRFKFPHPPSTRTLIAEPATEDNVTSHAIDSLSKVRNLLIDGHTDVTLNELLELAEVDPSHYEQALGVCSRGHTIVLKREPCDCNINYYNPAVMLAWQANMDLQYVLNAYACVMYVASYIMKTERSMGELLKQVGDEVRTEELTAQLRKVGTAFLTHREVSAQEAVYRILSLPMKQLSRTVVFVDTNPADQRIAVLKDIDTLSQLDESDTDVFCKSLLDRYQHRPQNLQSMSLAEFAATYVTDYRSDDNDQGDALPPDDSEITTSKITLTNGFGKMYMRRREAVIRFRRYNKDTEPSDWFRAKLMLYHPWRNEQTDLLGGFSTFEEHYRHVHSTVVANEAKYSEADIEDIGIDTDGPPEHLWDEIAPSTEENQSRSLQEGRESLTEVEQEDLQDNAEMLNSAVSAPVNAVQIRFETASNHGEIPPDEYRELLRGLNTQQKTMVMFHRNWCKKAVLALRQGRPVEPYRVFLSGPGGVGKSHVIRLIHSDTLKLLKLSGTIEPGDVTVLLTAPTGVAAYNIGGMTLHAALLLGCGRNRQLQPLSYEKLNTLRSYLSQLTLLIIDEVSMVGSNMLLDIHNRLQEIKGTSSGSLFAGISILAVGDLYQLPPVRQPPVFGPLSDAYAKLYGCGSLWKEEFQMIELVEVMRQRGDWRFTQLLCRVRTDDCTDEDIAILQSRVVTTDSPDYPVNALHVYRRNEDVDKHNSDMLRGLVPDEQQYCIQACDSIGGQTRHVNLSNLSGKRSDTGGLHGVLRLAVGARVMLTVNVDVSDGLVNGARGEVVHIVTSANDQVTKILVKFDNPNVGTKAVQSSTYQTEYPNAVPLVKHEATFLAEGRLGSEVRRVQFPLTLAWASTIHKVQGLTLDLIVVDMKGGGFNPGQAYVAFSRVKTLQGLYILNFNAAAISASDKVLNEMNRLNTKQLETVPPLQCLSLFDSHITLALLNVRSILAKLPDIECDQSMQCAKVLCFCETWLSPIQPSPQISDNHVALRCDRTSDNNRGGVMISIDRSLQPSNTALFTCEGIEGLITNVLLPNAMYLQIALVYRSPSTPVNTFVNVLSALLNRISSQAFPTLVMGDFNDDLTNSHNSTILSLMSSHGFTQLVSVPTTDRGTLIDHVYYNRPLDHVVVEVNDTYYSDHDTVYVSVEL